MPKAYNQYSVFISSPGDVAVERGICEKTIERISANVADSLRLSFVPNRWERHPPETPPLGHQSIQDVINERVKASDIFILILGARYGSIEDSHEKSNTEREVDTILEKKRKDRRITILCYLRRLQANPDPGAQESANLQFRERLKSAGAMWKEYVDHTDFEKEVVHDLYNLSIRLRTSPFKTDCLSRFLVPSIEATEHDRPVASDMAIIYRPVLRQFEDQSHDPSFWHKRLMPNVHFEDSKAIQKIQKLARLLGIQSKVYTVYRLPSDIRLMNRIWVCAPRMDQAHRVARERGASFEFIRTKTESYFRWKNAEGIINIRSPLSKYLHEQRRADDMQGEWSEKLGAIHARDFGLIARLPANDQDFSRENQTFDYFITGIRGLGTWGAAWYIDRKFRELRAIGQTGRVEILLEIHYQRGYIVDAVDVSDKPSSYFIEQNSLSTVRKHIRTALQSI